MNSDNRACLESLKASVPMSVARKTWSGRRAGCSASICSHLAYGRRCQLALCSPLCKENKGDHGTGNPPLRFSLYSHLLSSLRHLTLLIQRFSHDGQTHTAPITQQTQDLHLILPQATGSLRLEGGRMVEGQAAMRVAQDSAAALVSRSNAFVQGALGSGLVG